MGGPRRAVLWVLGEPLFRRLPWETSPEWKPMPEVEICLGFKAAEKQWKPGYSLWISLDLGLEDSLAWIKGLEWASDLTFLAETPEQYRALMASAPHATCLLRRPGPAFIQSLFKWEQRDRSTGRSVLLWVEDDPLDASRHLAPLALWPGDLIRCHTHEEALSTWGQLKPSILGLLSDMGFPRKGHLEPEAGLALAETLRKDNPGLPILLHSSEDALANQASHAGFSFVGKHSPQFLGSLNAFLRNLLESSDFKGDQPTSIEAAKLEGGRSFPPSTRTASTPFSDLSRRELAPGIVCWGSGHLGSETFGLIQAQALGTLDPSIRPTSTWILGSSLTASLIHLYDWTCPQSLPDPMVHEISWPSELSKVIETCLHEMKGPLRLRLSGALDDRLPGLKRPEVWIPRQPENPQERQEKVQKALVKLLRMAWAPEALSAYRSTPYHAWENALAIFIQVVPGAQHGEHFYPTFSGTALSFNAYPFQGLHPEDGVMSLALGLLVEESESLRVCPRHPSVLPQFSSTRDVFKNAQRRFWALDLRGRSENPISLDIQDAFLDGGASFVASTYRRTDDALVDGLKPDGTPLITFARLLRGRGWPLPQLISSLLDEAKTRLGCEVELEFQVQLESGAEPQLWIQGLRSQTEVTIEMDQQEGPRLRVARTAQVIGPQRSTHVQDLILVLPGLDRSRTQEAARYIEELNTHLKIQNRPYALIGPGRWGTRDPWLGIPVTWSQISMARIIAETDFHDLYLEPSQGSHFFQELTRNGVSYLSFSNLEEEAHLDWAWFQNLIPVQEGLQGLIRHVHLPQGLTLSSSKPGAELWVKEVSFP